MNNKQRKKARDKKLIKKYKKGALSVSYTIYLKYNRNETYKVKIKNGKTLSKLVKMVNLIKI